MKNCGECNWPWPDYIDACSVCGSQQFNDPSAAEPPSITRPRPLCCSNADCASLMFFNGAKYCSECGRNLQPVSWSAWEEKSVYPALEGDISGVAFDPSKLLQSASKMGFVTEEAESRFNNLFKQATNVSRNDFCAWVQESVLPLQDHKSGSATTPSQALLRAKTLKISETYSVRVVSQVVPPTDVSSGPVESYAASESPVAGLEPPPQTDPLATEVQVAVLSTDEALTDPLRNSAKSFYRRLVAGGSVTNNLIYLDLKRSASKEGLSAEFLKEASPQGAFVLFVSSENQGWVFPNPKLIFTPDSLKPLFPILDADQFDNFKLHIEPVRVIRIGKDRWQVRPSDKRSSDILSTSATSTEPRAPVTVTSAVGFPTSAADYLAKTRSSSTVVRHDMVRDFLVSGPDGKGELAIIREVTALNTESFFVIPRITPFRSTDPFYNFYERYYNCAKPSVGDVWIIDPAVVSEVKGGWQLHQKGVLEVRNYGTDNSQGKAPFVRPISDSPSPVIAKEEREPSDIFAPLPTRNPLRRVLFIVAIMAILLVVGIASLLPRTVVPPIPPKNEKSLSVQIPMVAVPGGVFQMGWNSGDEYERPQHPVTVKPFLIDTYEVTCEEYEKFLKENPSHRSPPEWVNRTYPGGTARRPVTGVDWYDATAYAEWAKKRLPTEEEWEFAARGNELRRYPWGDDWRQGAANADGASKGLADVGTYKTASPVQAYDMVGNAWEWTSSRLTAYPGGRLRRAPVGDLRVIRGGSWESDKDSATTTYRWGWPARGGKDYSNTGFRCVKEIPSAPSN